MLFKCCSHATSGHVRKQTYFLFLNMDETLPTTIGGINFFPHLQILKNIGCNACRWSYLVCYYKQYLYKTNLFFPSDTQYITPFQEMYRSTILQSLLNIKTNAYSIYIPSFTQAQLLIKQIKIYLDRKNAITGVSI